MDEYLDVKIDVFERAGQRARLRKTLTVSALIEEVLREFDDIAADSPQKYAVYLKGMDRPLAANQTLTQLDIQPQDELVFDYIRQSIRQMLAPRFYASLREETTNKAFDIQWYPAIIGRPTTEEDHNQMLAINVQLLPNGMTVSRKHAQITFSDGRFYIETLAENNPVYLNDKEVPINARRELKNGDKLLIGRNKIAMTFMNKPVTASTEKEPGSQPVDRSTPQPAQPPVPSPAQTPASVADSYNAPDKPQALYLVVERASQAEQVGQRLELLEFPFLLGRGLPLLSAETEVSRRHAEVTFDPLSKKFHITDLKSTNGVSMDGVAIEPNRPHEIKPGMRIGIGKVVVFRVKA
jgi:pSer/pThr/pTyr-binding forkhead associated (FHA) protein